jgi:hypothetical protein
MILSYNGVEDPSYEEIEEMIKKMKFRKQI